MLSEDSMDLSEAINRLAESQKPKTDDLSSELRSPSDSWDLNTPFGKARILAEEGWIEKADDLWSCIKALALEVEIGIQDRYDVAGESVDVGRFLSGEPECMMTQSISPQSSVDVFVNIVAPWNYDARLLFNRGIAIAAIVHALQSSRRSVSLVVGESVKGGNMSDHQHNTTIEIQSSSDYINPAELAFWLAHPAALRRCIFRYNEQQIPEIRELMGFKNSRGYGDGGSVEFPENSYSSETVYIPSVVSDKLEHYQDPEKSLARIVELFKDQGVPISIEGI